MIDFGCDADTLLNIIAWLNEGGELMPIETPLLDLVSREPCQDIKHEWTPLEEVRGMTAPRLLRLQSRGGGGVMETKLHRRFIQSVYEMLRRQRDKDHLERTDEECYYAAINGAGWECDHPAQFRLTLPFDTRRPRWDGMIEVASLDEYECGVCHSWIVRSV